MKLYVGTSGYSYPKWKGSFYPQKLAATKMLRFYAEHFRTVEANSTFFGMPKETVLEKWAGDVPAEFKFVLKAPKQITHIQRLQDSADSVSSMFASAGTLKDRLGPVLFQLPPFLKKDAPRLLAFLKLIPAGSRVAFEFRHESWFDDETFGLLRDHQAALCLADAGDDLTVPFVPTAGWGYLRLRRPDYDEAELKTWAERVLEQKWDEAFVFFKHEDEGKGPVFAKKFMELAGQPSMSANLG
ncbi:DUF72 domain-containing protein [Zavarzinella formosa]|uniref:DUF72 domain-containing protein n=1 Tax=Zavarzinella formosa TaxID=360055 RepID=UPI0002DD3323|nr:DUF72 domain-containing protein [Zavarzinella formosa]